MAHAACRSGLPGPAAGPKPPPSAFVDVPYPPPAGRVEIVPPRPDDAVWIDGQWTSFTQGQWVWEAGGWVAPPPDATFTRWTTERRPDGVLYFAAPAWYAKDGGTTAAPPFVARARRGDPATAREGQPDDTVGPHELGGGRDDAAPPSRPPPLLPDAGLIPPALAPETPLPGPPVDAGPDARPSSTPADAGSDS